MTLRGAHGPPRTLVQDKDFRPLYQKLKISPNNRRMGGGLGRCQGSPQTQPHAGTWAWEGFKYSQCEGLSCKSGLGVSGLAPLGFRMLQLKPQERQGEGGDGCCSKPSLLGWEKSQRIWGAGPLHLHPAPAVSKWDPSSHIQQHLHRPAQHRSVPPATAAGKGLRLWFQHLPALHFPVPGGPTQGTFPPSFCPCQGVFCHLWPPAWGKGRGSVSITMGPRQGWRVPTLLPSGSVPRAASHPAWGPQRS